MPQPPMQYSASETMNLIDERAKASPDRAAFYVKIFRKGPSQLVSQQVAAFADVTLAHLSDPARWLLQLGGGGDYALRVSHIDTPHQDLGGPLYFPFDVKPPNGVPIREIDASATFRDGWAGPPTMTMPNPVVPPKGQPSPEQVRAMIYEGTPYAQQMGVTPQQGTNLNFSLPPSVAAPPPAPLYSAEVISAREKSLLDREAAFNKESAEREARIREVQLKNDLDAKSREIDLKLARIQEASTRPAESGGFEKLIVALAPILQNIMTTQHEMRVLAMKQTEEASRAQIAAIERSQTQMLEFMKALTAPKKEGMSEEMRLVLEMLKADKSNNGVDAIASMTTRMLDAMNTVSKTSISMMEAMADQLAPAEEHPAVAAIREGVKAIGMMSAGINSGMRKSVPQTQAQQSMTRAMQPQPIPRPVPQQQPQVIYQAPQQPQHTQPQHIEVQVAQPTPQAVAETRPALSIDMLEEGIRQLAPIEDVAKYFVHLVKTKDPSLFAALKEADGDPDQLVIQRLGMEFVAQNTEYLEALSEEIEDQGDEAGIVEEETEPNGAIDVEVADVEETNGVQA